MFVCAKCGVEVSFGTITFTPQGDVSKSFCRVCKPVQNRDQAKSMFDGGFTLQHVLDENRKPITVNSLQELRRVEKEHNVSLACMSEDDISKPPQHEPWAGRIDHDYEKKFNRDPAAYAKVDASVAGVAKSADDTLVNRPNPI